MHEVLKENCLVLGDQSKKKREKKEKKSTFFMFQWHDIDTLPTDIYYCLAVTHMVDDTSRHTVNM